MTHTIKVQPYYYDKIKSGEKIYEVRLFDEKRQLMHTGDTLIIKKEPLLNEEITCKITKLLRFNSFKEMATSLPLNFVGFDLSSTTKDVIKLYYSFYSKQDEQKYGVVAIKVQLLN